MKFEVEELENNRKKVSIEVPSEVVTSTFNRVLRGLQENVELKGFRKGKVPLDLLRTQYQADANKHVIQELVQGNLPQALKDNGLKPAENPKIEPGTLLDGFPFKFSATFENIPKIDLKNYLGFKIKPESVEVKEEEVKEQLDRLHSSLGHFHDHEGDIFEGKIAGEFEFFTADSPEKLAESKGEKLIHEMGVGPLVESIEEKIRGIKKGESREFSNEVPTSEDGKEKKTFYYKVTLHGLKTKHLPPLYDESAKRFGNFKNLNELSEKITEELKAQKQQVQNDTHRQNLVEFLIKGHEIKVPESMKARWMQTIVYNYATELGKMGFSKEDIEVKLKEQGDSILTAAESQAKTSLILDAIGEKENIQASEEDFRKEIVRMAVEQRRNPKEVFEEIQNRGMVGAVVEKIQEVKTLDWLLGKATEA
jgi:trigger factor